jgi:hypothetical protein
MNYHTNGIGPSSSPETKQHTAALRSAQAQFKTIAKTADNPAFRSKYATFEGASETLLPFLTGAGFAMPTYHTGYYGPEMGWCCLGVLKHESGEWTSSLVPLLNPPQEKKDFKTGEIKTLPPNMQGFGGATTYAKRQLLLQLTGAWVGEADDDGNSVSHAATPKAQAAQVQQSNAKHMAYEAGAKRAVAEAGTKQEAEKHLALVELRAREKKIPAEVYRRVKGEFDRVWNTKEVAA